MGKCVFVLLIHIERGLPNPLDEESSVNYIHLQALCMGSTEAKRQISNLREQIRVFSNLVMGTLDQPIPLVMSFSCGFVWGFFE